jgi:hypothetical protein
MKKNSTLLMVGILGAVAILSAGLAVLPTTAMQQASAQGTDFSFEQEQENKCSRGATCSNTATITFAP